jgi:TolB-like protein/cytochrome c-type biogenesis protein CcmH/NrfG
VLQRLRERKLVQWALAYLAAAFVVFETIEILAQPWNLSLGFQRSAHIVLVLGLILTLILAWFHGEKGQQRVGGLELLMIALVLGVGGLTLSFLGPERRDSSDAGRSEPGVEDPRPSLAVLTCDNFSPEPADAYLGPGLHDEILQRLSKISALKSIGRVSVMQFGENPPPTEVIARQLRVDFVGQCGVTKAGDALRLTFELLDGKTGTQVWADQFDTSFSMSNLLAIYSEIAERVTSGLGATLTPDERIRIEATPTENLEAYRLYLTGRQYYFAWEEESLKRSVSYFDQAIERDREWALPYAAQAASYWLLSFVSSENPSVFLSHARAAAETAVELDPTLGDPLAILAVVRTIEDYDWQEAAAEFRRAVELGPDSYDVHMTHGSFFLSALGEHEQAEAELLLCVELDPLNIVAELELSWVYFVAREYRKAIAHLRAALEVDPSYPMGIGLLGLAYEQVGETELAVEALQRAADITQGRPFFRVLLARGYAFAGEEEGGREILNDLSNRWPETYTTPYYMAAAYASLGEQDRAFEWLERGLETHDPWMVFAKEDPVLDSLRTDPRFQGLLRRLRLTEGD